MRRLALLFVFLLGCEGPDAGARTDPTTAPSGQEFRPVAQVLLRRCGSIDCHGSRYRNMRLVGFGSIRLDPSHRPDAPDTTDPEVDQIYEAVVALEPDVLREVVADGGRSPERLSLVRKGQAAEAHKGGQRIVPGDDADACIKSWLTGRVDVARCAAAAPPL